VPGEISIGAGGVGDEIGGTIGDGFNQQSGIDIDGPPTDGGSGMASGPAKFVQEGGSIDYIPGADVLVGAVVVQADLIGVTQAPIKAGQLGSIAVTGVFDFNKAVGAGSAIPAGTLTYWDAAAQNATKNAAAGANKLIGKAVKATVDADTIVRVRLQQ
jgi:predicted RecA/RadA family phage recombinase